MMDENVKELWCDFAIENGKFSESIRHQLNFIFSVQVGISGYRYYCFLVTTTPYGSGSQLQAKLLCVLVQSVYMYIHWDEPSWQLILPTNHVLLQNSTRGRLHVGAVTLAASSCTN